MLLCNQNLNKDPLTHRAGTFGPGNCTNASLEAMKVDYSDYHFTGAGVATFQCDSGYSFITGSPDHMVQCEGNTWTSYNDVCEPGELCHQFEVTFNFCRKTV